MAKKTTPHVAAPPARKSKTRLTKPVPGAQETPDKLTKRSTGGSASYVDLNFKVPRDFHRRFRIEASLRAMSMKDLLEAAFKSYLEIHGGTMEKPRSDLL